MVELELHKGFAQPLRARRPSRRHHPGMRYFIALVVLLLAAAGYASGDASGIRWERSLEDACARAKREGKLVVLLQLHGDFDRELC